MSTHLVELNSDLVRFLRPLSDRPLREVTEELLVLELYRRRQLSSGKAAELLGMSRWEFVHYAARQGIAFFDLNEDEIADEFARVDRLKDLPTDASS
jgi:predicted HTH domain antitoxin